MANYIIRRFLLMFPTLLGMMAVVFFIMKASPGDPVEMLLGRQGEVEPGNATQERNYIRKRYGLDKPVVVQFGRWLNQISPVGFRMSDDIKFDEKTTLATQEAIQNTPHLLEHLSLKQAVVMTESIAAYNDENAITTAKMLAETTTTTQGIVSLLVELGTLDRGAEHVDASPPLTDQELEAQNKVDDSEGKMGAVVDDEVSVADRIYVLKRRVLLAADKDFEAGSREFVAAIKWLDEVAPKKASEILVGRLAADAGGLNRVLFSRPAFKEPDLGESMTKKRPVSDLLGEALPVTLLLNVLSLPVIFISVGIGVYAAKFRGKSFDVWSGVLLLAFWSFPVIAAGVLLQGFFANEEYHFWFPHTGIHDVTANDMPFFPQTINGEFTRGWLLDLMWHLVLPVFCLSYTGLAFMSKLTRGAVLENIKSDYVRTARAKGLDNKAVLWRHAFRNSLLPMVTMFAFMIPGMLGGSIIVERIFGIPGMGSFAIDSIFLKDQDAVMAVTLLSGILTLFAYLLADILYAFVDPRVTYE